MTSTELTNEQAQTLNLIRGSYNPSPDTIKIYSYSEFIVVEFKLAGRVFDRVSIHNDGHKMGV